jgi:phosphoglycolate/pyridoxal phosphate phosphatase family enzyme
MAQRLTAGNLEALREWLAGVDTFLVDCDGVLWRATDGVDGVSHTVDALRAAGKRVYFVTNNSTKSRAAYVHKLQHTAGIHAAPEAIISSAYAAAVYCKAHGINKKVYMVGEGGLEEELRSVAGVDVLGPEDWGKAFEFGTFHPTDLDPDVQAVVAGFDGKFCYYKLAKAAAYLRYVPGCRFVATNRDLTYPDKHIVTPGGGTLIACIEAGAGRAPDVVAGKPSAGLLEIVEEATGLDRRRTCMVGDRLDTDILFGNAGGLGSSLLVMTGVTSEAELAALREGDAHRPTHVLDSFGDLHKLMQLL